MFSRLPYDLFKVVAKRCVMVSPNMKRLTIDCTDLPIRPALPAQWLKVFITDKSTGKNVGRAYTVRHYNSATHELDLDFYLHGDTGPVGAWAMRVQAGDEFEVSELRSRSGVDVSASAATHVLLGDETALPAISAIIEALPATAQARAFISLADQADRVLLRSAAPLSIGWLQRSNALSGTLIEWLSKVDLSSDSATQYWVAGESVEVKAIRNLLLERGVSAAAIDASGYWKQGQADHRDD